MASDYWNVRRVASLKPTSRSLSMVVERIGDLAVGDDPPEIVRPIRCRCSAKGTFRRSDSDA
jgi:hypothetical protein